MAEDHHHTAFRRHPLRLGLDQSTCRAVGQAEVDFLLVPLMTGSGKDTKTLIYFLVAVCLVLLCWFIK